MWLSLVERYVRDVEVAGSNPVISTRKTLGNTRFPRVFRLSCYAVFRGGVTQFATQICVTPWLLSRFALQLIKTCYFAAQISYLCGQLIFNYSDADIEVIITIRSRTILISKYALRRAV